MAALPRVSGSDAARAFAKVGYEMARQRGSHVRLRHVDGSRPPLTARTVSLFESGARMAVEGKRTSGAGLARLAACVALLASELACGARTEMLSLDETSADPPGSRVKALALGGQFSCVLVDDGTLRCWGWGWGYGYPHVVGDNELPSSVGRLNLNGKVVQFAPGFWRTFVLLEGGVTQRLGEDDCFHDPCLFGYRQTLSAVDLSLGGEVIRLASGTEHACATLDGGRIRCWGRGDDGELGYANTRDVAESEIAAAGAVNVGGEAIQVVLGDDHTCALLEGGKVRCWGLGAQGQLGYANTSSVGDDEIPAAAGDINVGGVVVQLAAGSRHTCALLEGGAVRCWGSGMHGQLGYAATNDVGDDETPASVGDVDVGDKVTALSAGNSHTCALLETGAVRCWGAGSLGRLGYGNANNIGDDEAPAAAGNVNVGAKVIQIAGTPGYHTCVLLETGVVRCWGNGPWGQLGYGDTQDIGDDETPAFAGDVPIF